MGKKLQEKLQEAVCCWFFQGSVELLKNASSKSGLGSTWLVRCKNENCALQITNEAFSTTLVTLYVQFLCSDWSKFDRWVRAENLCSILKLVYFESWSWQSFVSACDVFNCLFPLDVQNEILLLSRSFKSLLLFTASLFIGVLVEKYVACQSRKSDFGWHRFRVSPCLRLFSLCTLVRFETIIWPSSRFDYKLIEL